MDLCWHIMSLLFNMLSNLVTAFLPRSESLLISWLQSPSSVILESKKIVCHGFHYFPNYLPWSDGTGCYDLYFLNVEFQASFFTLFFHFHQEALLVSLRVVSSAYLRLLIFLPAILIPACFLSSPVFPMMYSAYKLNKQDDNILSWHTPFPVWNQSVIPCTLLTVASWLVYRFCRGQVR